MSTKGIEILQRRAREVRARALIRKWEYRQRHHAKGPGAGSAGFSLAVV